MPPKAWLALAAVVAVAAYTGWLINVGRGLERADQAAATAAANKLIAEQNAALAAKRASFDNEVDKAVQTAIAGIMQGLPPAFSAVPVPVAVPAVPAAVRCEEVLPLDVVKKLNRIGRP